MRRSTDGLQGQITIDNPDAIRIGDGISGRLTVTARKNISARSAALRLVGARIAEQDESKEERDSEGHVTHSESWVEVHGSLFAEEAYLDLPLPAAMSAGQTFDAPFTIPAPRLGPVSAHVGSALIGWAVEAKWDISMGGDERVAVPVTVHQNLDYLRSGAVRLESGAMFDVWSEGDGSIAVKPLPPIVAGTPVEVTVTWPQRRQRSRRPFRAAGQRRRAQRHQGPGAVLDTGRPGRPPRRRHVHRPHPARRATDIRRPGAGRELPAARAGRSVVQVGSRHRAGARRRLARCAREPRR